MRRRAAYNMRGPGAAKEVIRAHKSACKGGAKALERSSFGVASTEGNGMYKTPYISLGTTVQKRVHARPGIRPSFTGSSPPAATKL